MAQNKIIQPYSSVPYIPFNDVSETERNGAQFFSNVKQLSVGFGSRVFRVDRDGMWAGAETFAAAPWSVDWDGNMIASSLTISGYIPTGEALNDIGVGGITAAYISVSSLSAISANIGSITSGTITGTLVRTSSSGSRVQMNDSTDALEVYDASAKRMALDADEFIFYGTDGIRMGSMTNASGFLVMEVDSTSYAIVFQVDGTIKASVTNAGLNVNDDILASAGGIDIGSASQPFEDFYIDDIRLTAQTNNPTADGMLRYYNSGGTEGLRMQLGGSDFQFDASGV